MAKLVKVSYNADTLQTKITVNGKPFDTSRINGKEIADWAYPFMMRKVRWNGFYEEMVKALGGEKTFNLAFEGSEKDLDELKESWEDAPVTIISGEDTGNTVVISYDENSLTTDITINGKPFDTSRIKGKEIEDWVYPFMMRKVKWDGIFEELSKVVGSEKYTIEFSGSNAAMKELMEECPESVAINFKKNAAQSVYNSACKNDATAEMELKSAEELYIHGKTKEAFPIFEKLAESGNARAMFFLSEYYEWGDYGIENDREKGRFWREKGAEAGDPLAKQSLWYDYGVHSEEWDRIMESVFPEIKQMAESGDIIAQDILADFYMGTYPKEENWEQGIYWLKKSAQNGYWRSQDALGENYFSGEGVEFDYTEAEKWYRKAAEQGYIVAQFDLGNFYHCGGENYAEAVKWFRKAAEQGYKAAQYSLGECYYNGEGVEQNYAEAVKWYRKAAEQGYMAAKNALGKCYYNGEGVEQNYAEAVKWYRKAAEQGHSMAQNTLGDCYYFGDGIQQNYAEAVKWYRKAAEGEYGYVLAQENLGYCYYLGNGVQQNYAEAVKWFRKAAEKDVASAQHMLGNCYYNGNGVEQNYVEAVKWFRRAAEQNNASAQDMLGECYYFGNGVQQSYTEAVKWYRKALEQDNPEAYYDLGSCYRWGYGVSKDKEKAKELFQKGIKLGSESCKTAYNEMLKNADRIEKAKSIGGKALDILGGVAADYAQAALYDDDDDDDDEY